MKKPALKPELKLGAEPKKVMLLAGLLVVAVIVYFINSSDSPAPAATPAAPSGLGSTLPSPSGAPRPAGPRGTQRPPNRNFAQKSSASTSEFRPTLKPKEPIDPARVDPTLNLDQLAKVRSVGVSGGHRSLFDFASAPPPKAEVASVKPIVPGPMGSGGFVGPVVEKPKPEAPPPPPPPIPLKFYGFTNPMKQGVKRAFFMEGEDIFVAGEGELIKNRYKVVRIGVNSAVVEDTSNKHQQTLPLEPEQVNS
jgi:hypothetical protein